MKKLIALLVCLLLVCTGCSSRQTETNEIVATTAPVWQFTQAVCADTDLSVGLVVSDSVSCLHDYTLSVRQMEAVEQAEVVVLSGCGLEDFMEDALQGKDVHIDSSEGIGLLCTETGEAHDDHDHDHEGHDHGEYDPHIWLDPDNAAVMTRNIAAGLSEQYPDYADQFTANAEAYCEKLAALKTDGQALLADLSCRELITFHDGFTYFADAFDLTILAAIEEESGSEASAKELEEIIDLVNGHHLPAVFVEENGSKSAASVISSETGCTTNTLDMIMSGTDYFEAMEANLQAVKEGLS